MPLIDGTDIEFYFGEQKKLLKIKNWVYDSAAVQDGYYGHIFTVTFETSIPKVITKETLCLAQCWEPSLYTCTDSDFVNIAGAGHLSRIDHMRIQNCSYKNLMNSGILLGAEFPVHSEGGHATDIRICDCTFENCGATARYGAKGCIGIKSHGLSGKNNKNIYIENCEFKNSDIGIDVHDAQDVYVKNCKFNCVDEKVRVEASTCCGIYIE